MLPKTSSMGTHSSIDMAQLEGMMFVTAFLFFLPLRRLVLVHLSANSHGVGHRTT